MKLMRASRNPNRTRAEAIASEVDFFQTAGSTTLFRDDKALAERSGKAYDRSFHPVGVARQYAALLATGDLRKQLAKLLIPTLVLHGSADGIFLPRSGRETAAAIPGATFRLVEGWGHDIAEGAWEILADAIAEHALGKKVAKSPPSSTAHA
jgi:pimeloyl-ACP methyl ester carboxylesterase